MYGPFRGSEAIAAGVVTRGQLAGPLYQQVYRDVYIPAGMPLTHPVRCECAALVLPGDAAITGRSAATVRGTELAFPGDPVEAAVGLETRVFRRAGVDLRRCEVRDDEAEPWSRVRLATPSRMAFDLLLDQPLPDAVADLDAVLRTGLVDRQQMARFLDGRHDRGIVGARQALVLADPRAESRPESRVRVHLVRAGLAPEVQYWIEDARGRLARVDLAFPEQQVAVEYDGQWRENEMWALNRDRDRLNRVQAAGWEIVFVTAALLRDPRLMVHTVRAALERSNMHKHP